MAGGWRAVQVDSQQQLEVEGNDVGCQADEGQQWSIHAAQPDQSLVLHNLDYHLQRSMQSLSVCVGGMTTTWLTICRPACLGNALFVSPLNGSSAAVQHAQVCCWSCLRWHITAGVMTCNAVCIDVVIWVVWYGMPQLG